MYHGWPTTTSHTRCYLSALRNLQIAHNHPDSMISTFPKLESVIRGIKMQQARHKTSAPKQLPITLDLLHKLHSFFVSKGHEADSFMLWAAICTCFFGFMRSGEMTIPSESAFDSSSHFCFNDVSVDNIADPRVVKVRLKASKTDPFRQRVEIVLIGLRKIYSHWRGSYLATHLIYSLARTNDIYCPKN